MTGTADPVGNLAIGVVKAIEDMLATCALMPGQRLVEADLMARLNVGRIPVREALRILAGDGIVQLSPGRGARVRTLGPERLLAMMQFIGAVTGFAVQTLADRGVGPAVASQLEAAQARIETAIEAGIPIRIIEEMGRFLDVVVDNAGNEYVVEVWARMHMPHYQRHLFEHMPTADILAAARKFAAYKDALLAGDRERALALDQDIALPFLQRATNLVGQKAETA